ncbi:MAG TPA: DUF2259 domain-containing protein [Rhizobiales bacterium]|nr:DUF2259 domain-containing protein [Hyphomicrobiales bacterium]
MIRTLFIFVWMVIISTAGLAGNTADRNIIGFSPDGTWFAFEEYGINDGSGAPFTNIYVINVDKDEWARGTPVRVNFGEKVAPVSAARNMAHKQVQSILDSLGITEPGILLASNPVTEITSNPRRIDFYRNKNIKSPANKLSYVLKELDFPENQTCKSFGVNEKGFSLSLTKGGSPLIQVYKDKKIPASRRCPMEYAISDVIEFNPLSGPSRHVVLVHMFVLGFEGPDSRFLAVPVTLP